MQEKALHYIQSNNLCDPKAPTMIRLDDNLRQALSTDSDDAADEASEPGPIDSSTDRITIFDFVDRIRSILIADSR